MGKNKSLFVAANHLNKINFDISVMKDDKGLFMQKKVKQIASFFSKGMLFILDCKLKKDFASLLC